MQISKNRANLIMRNGHELTYQNAESKRLCMLDSLDFESKDYKKRILLPLLISPILWSGDSKLAYKKFTTSLFIFGFQSENHEKLLLQSSSPGQKHATEKIARIDPHDGLSLELPGPGWWDHGPPRMVYVLPPA